MDASPYHSASQRTPDPYSPSPGRYPSPTKALRDIADDDEYDPEQPAIRQPTPEHQWLSDNSHVVAQDSRLQHLIHHQSWTSDDKAYVRHIIGQFDVYDMPSFLRVQAHHWILYNMHVLQQHDFLARMFDKMRHGKGISANDAGSLTRTIWRLMSAEDRRVASEMRRDAERQYGPMERPQRRQSRTVAGYPVAIAEAYLNYHRVDVDQFAQSYVERRGRPRYNAVPPPY